MNDPLAPQDTAEIAAWICDETNPAEIRFWKLETVPALFQESADGFGVRLGPIRFYELEPGSGRAGHPPKGFQGTRVRLLVAECKIIGLKPVVQDNSFIADLGFKDLQTLRKITKQAALPNLISDAEADRIIERYGPITAQKILKSVVDDKITLH